MGAGCAAGTTWHPSIINDKRNRISQAVFVALMVLIIAVTPKFPSVCSPECASVLESVHLGAELADCRAGGECRQALIDGESRLHS